MTEIFLPYIVINGDLRKATFVLRRISLSAILNGKI